MNLQNGEEGYEYQISLMFNTKGEMKGGRDCMRGDGDGRPREGKRTAEGGYRGLEWEQEPARGP
jgi:hypothetical protein